MLMDSSIYKFCHSYPTQFVSIITNATHNSGWAPKATSYCSDFTMDAAASDLFGINPAEVDQDWNLDPSEPRYCICRQVSYGDMVACDNEEVSSLALFVVSQY